MSQMRSLCLDTNTDKLSAKDRLLNLYKDLVERAKALTVIMFLSESNTAGAVIQYTNVGGTL